MIIREGITVRVLGKVVGEQVGPVRNLWVHTYPGKTFGPIVTFSVNGYIFHSGEIKEVLRYEHYERATGGQAGG